MRKEQRGLSKEDKQRLADFRRNLREQKELRAKENFEYYEDEDDLEYYESQDFEEDECEEEMIVSAHSQPGYVRFVEKENRKDGYFENIWEREANRSKTYGKYVNGKKTHCLISTIGHIGHGKTTLTAAITKVLHKRLGTGRAVDYELIDKAEELKEEGLSISRAHVEYETYSRHYMHIDCPTHADYVKIMVTSLAQIHAAILVVAATDGVWAQTREQISLARAIGIPYIVVFMNHCDLLDDPELLELDQMEICELLNEYDFPGDDTPIIRGSALKALEDPDSEWGDRILELMDAVDSWIPDPLQTGEQPFLMPIEDIFTIHGRGTVVTGRVERGILRLSQEIEILDNSYEEPRRTIVTGIEMFSKLLDEAWAGDNVGLLLRGVQSYEVERGFCLCSPGSVRCYHKFIAQCYIFTKDEGGCSEPFVDNCHTILYFRTAQVAGVCKLPHSIKMCMPGDNIEMVVELNYPTAMEQGLLFEIRKGDRIVGRGKVASIIQ